MQNATTPSSDTPDTPDMPGYLLPEDMHENLLDLIDELHLLVALTATGNALDDEILPGGFKRASLAGYLRRVAERIEVALKPCRYAVPLSDLAQQ